MSRRDDERERLAADVIRQIDAALDGLQGAQEWHVARLRELLSRMEHPPEDR
jgi:hypothetical protein